MEFLKNKSVKITIILLGLGAAIILIFSMFNKKEGSVTNSTDLERAAKSYLNQKKELYPKENEKITIKGTELVDAGYLKGSSECYSYITVSNIQEEYYYNPIVKCGEKNEIITLYDKVIAVKNDLKEINDEFYFKGENINNNVVFNKMEWHIIKIDKDRNIKLILNSINQNSISSLWDNRYNLEKKINIGINTDFTISRAKETLDKLFAEKFNNKTLSYLTPYNLCIGKRSAKSLDLSGIEECSKTADNQYFGLLQANEYLIASNDPNCAIVSMESCKNYNFNLDYIWTQTAVKENTYEAFAIDYKGLINEDTNISYELLPVITLHKDAIVSTGDGSLTNPYIIK